MARTILRLMLAALFVQTLVWAGAPPAVAQPSGGNLSLALDFDLYRDTVEADSARPSVWQRPMCRVPLARRRQHVSRTAVTRQRRV